MGTCESGEDARLPWGPRLEAIDIFCKLYERTYLHISNF